MSKPDKRSVAISLIAFVIVVLVIGVGTVSASQQRSWPHLSVQDAQLMTRAARGMSNEQIMTMVVLTKDGRLISPLASTAEDWHRFEPYVGNLKKNRLTQEIRVFPSAQRIIGGGTTGGTTGTTTTTGGSTTGTSTTTGGSTTGTTTTTGSSTTTGGSTTGDTTTGGSTTGGSTTGTTTTGGSTTGDTTTGGSTTGETTGGSTTGSSTTGGTTTGGTGTCPDNNENGYCDLCDFGSSAIVNDEIYGGTGPYRRVRIKPNIGIRGIKSDVYFHGVDMSQEEHARIMATPPRLGDNRAYVYYSVNAGDGEPEVFDVGFMIGFDNPTSPTKSVLKSFFTGAGGATWLGPAHVQIDTPANLSMSVNIETDTSGTIVRFAAANNAVIVIEGSTNSSTNWTDGDEYMSYTTSIAFVPNDTTPYTDPAKYPWICGVRWSNRSVQINNAWTLLNSSHVRLMVHTHSTETACNQTLVVSHSLQRGFPLSRLSMRQA